MALQTEILNQIDAVLKRYEDIRSLSQWPSFSDLPGEDVAAVVTLMSDCIRRLAPPNSQYVQAMAVAVNSYALLPGTAAPYVAGALSALRSAYASGYLTTVSELIHAELFSDFIQMSEYLLSEGYKDPAAVIIGSLLEEHLR